MYLYIILTRLRTYIKVDLVNSAKVARGWTISSQTRARAIYWWFFSTHAISVGSNFTIWTNMDYACNAQSFVNIGIHWKGFLLCLQLKKFQGACTRGNVYKSYNLITYLQLDRMRALITLALGDLTLNTIILTFVPSVGFETILLNTVESMPVSLNPQLSWPTSTTYHCILPTPSPNTSSFGKSCNSCLH